MSAGYQVFPWQSCAADSDQEQPDGRKEPDKDSNPQKDIVHLL
jgi:hypothetical protein